MSFGTGDDVSGGTDALADTFYPLYQRVFPENSDFVEDVELKLAQARMTETAELFLSRALAYGVITGLVLWILGVFFGWLVFVELQVFDTSSLIGVPLPEQWMVDLVNAVKIPALVLVIGVVMGSIGFGLGFGSLVAIPYSRASSRKREINMLLPDAVAFMYALSIGGLNQLEILEAMAKADDTYGEVANEFKSIAQETEYFDTDYRTALRNQALETPSDELSQFLIDMLSIVNSGGDLTDFLSDKKDKHMRTAKQQQEMTLETLELFGEMYMTLSLFPLLLIIILVIMSMLGDAKTMLLLGTVYALIPMTGAGFLVLISTVKQDEPGDGYLYPDGQREAFNTAPGLLNLGLVERFTGTFSIFDRIRSREGTHETAWLLRNPHLFFRDNPTYTLALTVPAALVVVAGAVYTDVVPTAWQGLCAAAEGSQPVSCGASDKVAKVDGERVVLTPGMVQMPVWSTFVYAYVPIYVVALPLTVFYEWNIRSRKRIVSKLSDNLRKLSSANDTGLTLLESIKSVSDTSSGKLGEEFEIMYTKVNYGTNLRDALLEFNNKYHIPRLARTVKLISKAQEASSQITDVLTTAAQASENQDDIERERKSRTRMQVAIILMTYLTLLGVMAILKTQFLDVISGLSQQAGSGGGGAAAGGGGGTGMSQSFGASLDTSMLSLLFFHAVTLQAVLSGFISGYIRDAKLMSGLKFVVVLATIALLVWTVVG